MRLLIAGAKSKFFHLKEFGDALTKFGVEYKLVHDLEIYTGFPSKNIRDWFPSKKKFNALISEFKPDAVFIDRQAHFGLATIDAKIPLFILLRGDYWSEIKWARETLYKSPIKRAALWQRDRIAKKCFSGAAAIIPICKYLEPIVRQHYPEKLVRVIYGGTKGLSQRLLLTVSGAGIHFLKNLRMVTFYSVNLCTWLSSPSFSRLAWGYYNSNPRSRILSGHGYC